MNIAGLSNVKEMLKNNESKRFIRFVAVGIMNTLVDFVFYSICVGLLNLHYNIGQVVGYSAGVLNSFIMNKFWTFENKEVNAKTTQQFIQFVVVNIVSLGITLLGLRMVIDGLKVNKYIAKLIVTLVAQLVNYFGYKLWVFKKADSV